MIPVAIFNLLAAAGALLFLYAIIDYQHKIYANIACGFIAGFIFMYLSAVAGSGAVYDGTSCSLAINNTSVIPYDCTTRSSFTDYSLYTLFQFVAVIAWVYCLVMAAMIYLTWKKNKKDKDDAELKERRGF
jgi:hypothetical protein